MHGTAGGVLFGLGGGGGVVREKEITSIGLETPDSGFYTSGDEMTRLSLGQSTFSYTRLQGKKLEGGINF